MDNKFSKQKRVVHTDVGPTPKQLTRKLNEYRTDDSYQSENYQDPSIISENSDLQSHSLASSQNNLSQNMFNEYQLKANVKSLYPEF